MTDNTNKKAAAYRPDVFEVNDLESAMPIILTPESGTTTQERWEYETPYLVGELGRTLGLDGKSCVLDYGCGIGRIAKGLIERHHCFVVGVDISAGMRELAADYVKSERFVACAPEMFDRMIAQGFRVTHACACWVIQHCAAPETDLARIESALAGDGRLFVLNSNRRRVPTDQGWADDGISVEKLLAARFEIISKSNLPEAITTREIADFSYTMILRKRR